MTLALLAAGTIFSYQLPIEPTFYEVLERRLAVPRQEPGSRSTKSENGHYVSYVPGKGAQWGGNEVGVA